jgi:hypothetical protein
MPREPAYIRTFKTFAKGNPSFGDLPNIEAEVYGGNDRARAVMLSAILETSLEIFIRNKTRPSLNADDTSRLLDQSGLLGDFGAKILAGYAFNFYGPDTRHDLDLIRILRNGFAHSRIHFQFTTSEVAGVCSQLRAPDSAGAFIPHAWLRLASKDDLSDAADTKHPRTRYVMTCHIIAERLLSNVSNAPLDQVPLDLP